MTKRRASKPKSGKVTKRDLAPCGADPAGSLFPEQAPRGCVLVRAHYRRVKGKRRK